MTPVDTDTLVRQMQWRYATKAFDPAKPAVTSGIRLGTPAATTRGFGVAEFEEVGRMIGEVLDGLSKSNDGTNAAVEAEVGARVQALCAKFPIYR